MLKLIFVLLASLPTFGQEIIHLTEENSVSFNKAVTASYVSAKQFEIAVKSGNLPKSKPLYLVLNTPGGSVIDGLRFIDSLKALDRPIHTITIFAASMGYQIVQELDRRFILPSGTLMSHRGAVGGLSGQIPGELNARLNHIQSLLERMNVVAAKRIGMSTVDYQASIVNELWSFGENAVKTNQADEVVLAQCSKELISKVVREKVSTPFGTFEVDFSSCPLITTPVSFASMDSLKPELREKVQQIILEENRKVNLTY